LRIAIEEIYIDVQPVNYSYINLFQQHTGIMPCSTKD